MEKESASSSVIFLLTFVVIAMVAASWSSMLGDLDNEVTGQMTKITGLYVADDIVTVQSYGNTYTYTYSDGNWHNTNVPEGNRNVDNAVNMDTIQQNHPDTFDLNPPGTTNHDPSTYTPLGVVARPPVQNPARALAGAIQSGATAGSETGAEPAPLSISLTGKTPTLADGNSETLGNQPYYLVNGHWYNSEGDLVNERGSNNLDRQKTAQDQATAEAVAQDRQDQAAFIIGSIFSPGAGDTTMAEWLGGDDVSFYDSNEDIPEWMSLALDGYLLEYELCRDEASSYFYSDSPTSFQGGGPSINNLIVANGERTAYPVVLPEFRESVTGCNFEEDSNGIEGAKWFPQISQTGNASAEGLGYLYIFSWSVGNPTSGVDDMSLQALEREGLDKDGNITYRIKLQGTACPNQDIEDVHWLPGPNLHWKAPPGQISTMSFSSYDKSYITSICIEFLGNRAGVTYKYYHPGDEAYYDEWPPSCTATVNNGGFVQESPSAYNPSSDFPWIAPPPEADDTTPQPPAGTGTSSGGPQCSSGLPGLCFD